jgi:hypothetical protein
VDTELFKTLGLGGSSIAVIAYVLWQLFIKIKGQMKEDSKGDKIDDRIDKYSATLQQTIDKLVIRIDDMQKVRDDLVVRSAQLAADLGVAKTECAALKIEVDAYIERVKYLEGILDEKGINYVQQS